MPAVFIHGVPNTSRLWDPLRSALGRDDAVALRLPGFGNPRPSDFTATKEAYTEWLVNELARIDGPIDLVGHDWGCNLVLRLASLRVVNLRSWACGNGVIDRAYVWHDTAQMWQTPEVGEQIMRDLITPEVMQMMFETEGAAPALAAAEAGDIDDTMKACILDLYRSATQIGEDWEDGLNDIAAPGLVMWAQADQYVAPEFGDRLASRTGSELVRFECGHFWPLAKPSDAADALTAFWAHLP